jgi:hypothetical protein
MLRPPRIVLYPFFIALYGVLAFAAKNSQQLARLGDLVSPVVLSLAVALGAWVVSRLVSREMHVRALVTLVGVAWFAAYGYFQHALFRQPWLSVFSPHRYAIPTFLLLLSAAAYVVVHRWPRPLEELSRYLNVTTGVLLLFPVFTLVAHPPRFTTTRAVHAVVAPVHASGPVALADAPTRPNVYLIILDKYTGWRSLARNFGFDNRAFEDSLRHLGLVVPRAPHANYIHTHLALASMLNWRLLDDRPRALSADVGAVAMDDSAIENNRTWRFLHERGYRFFFFPSFYETTTHNRFADLQLPDPSQVTSEYEGVWRQTTLAAPFVYWWCRTFACRGHDPFTASHANVVDWKFEQLAQLPDSAGPIFAFAHLILPHEPYIFNADCSQRVPYLPAADTGAEEPLVKVAYVEQIQCVNRKILTLVHAILARSATPPIIILQADHGHGRMGRIFVTAAVAGPERVAERIDPFAAYYLPGHPEGVVYDSITPVNVLPRIFNYYFDADIPLQPDATFWSTWDYPFQFRRIR